MYIKEQIASLARSCEEYDDETGKSLASISDLLPILSSISDILERLDADSEKYRSELEAVKADVRFLGDFCFQRLGGPTVEEVIRG